MTNVVLREVQPDDLESLFEFQREPAGAEMAAFPSRDREAFFEHWTKNILNNETAIVRTIVHGGRVVGSVNCFERDGLTLVGYWLGQEFWGKGIATAALRMLVEQVTRRPLHAFVAKHNVASVRVLEKCGFAIREGRIADDGIEEFLLRLDG